MQLSQLRNQLAELKKKETIAQTREQVLLEEKQALLSSVEELYALIRPLSIVPEEDLTPNNLANVVSKLQSYIDDEISRSSIPQELL